MRILIIFLFSILIFPNKSSFADLGSAEYESKSDNKKEISFDAWCAEKYNNCLVEIKFGRLTVDKSTGITSSQLINWDREVIYKKRDGLTQSHHLYNYNFKFRSKNNEIKTAKIIFQNAKYSDIFYQTIKSWAGSKEKRCSYDFDSRQNICY